MGDSSLAHETIYHSTAIYSEVSVKMAFDDDEIKRELKRQRTRKDRAPLKETSDEQARKRLEQDILLLLTKSDDRAFFLRQVENLTARHGLRMGSEQRSSVLRLYDQYQKQRASR
jgi:hypothetical protein